jgi:hypothetical protein
MSLYSRYAVTSKEMPGRRPSPIKLVLADAIHLLHQARDRTQSAFQRQGVLVRGHHQRSMQLSAEFDDADDAHSTSEPRNRSSPESVRQRVPPWIREQVVGAVRRALLLASSADARERAGEHAGCSIPKEGDELAYATTAPVNGEFQIPTSQNARTNWMNSVADSTHVHLGHNDMTGSISHMSRPRRCRPHAPPIPPRAAIGV